MSDLWSDRERRAWQDFLAAVESRAQLETDIRSGYTQRELDIDQVYQDALALYETESQSDRAAFEKKKEDTIGGLRAKYGAAHTKAKNEYLGIRHKANEDYVAQKAQLEADYKESRWTIGTIREADTKNSQDQHTQQQQEAASQLTKIENQRKQALETLSTWKLEIDEKAPKANPPKFPDPWQDLQHHVDASKNTHEAMKTYSLPKNIMGARPYLYMIAAWIVLSGAAAVAGDLWWAVLLAVPAIVFPVGLIIRQVMVGKLEVKAEEFWLQIEQSLADAKVAKQNALELAKKEAAAPQQTSQSAV